MKLRSNYAVAAISALVGTVLQSHQLTDKTVVDEGSSFMRNAADVLILTDTLHSMNGSTSTLRYQKNDWNEKAVEFIINSIQLSFAAGKLHMNDESYEAASVRFNESLYWDDLPSTPSSQYMAPHLIDKRPWMKKMAIIYQDKFTLVNKALPLAYRRYWYVSALTE